MAKLKKFTWSGDVRDFVEYSRVVKHEEIPTMMGDLSIKLLEYDPENARLYTTLDVASGSPSQEEIHNALLQRDQTKERINQLKDSGQLDPVCVIDKTFRVFEGNTRLAALRELNRRSPTKFKTIRCEIYPSTLEESHIFHLTGVWHLQGKDEWQRFDQAGRLARHQERDPDAFEDEIRFIGITQQTARADIKTYRTMDKYYDNTPTHWSFYHVLLNNKEFKDLGLDDRTLAKNFEKAIVKEIKDESIGVASTTFRARLPDVLKNTRQRKGIASGKYTFVEAYESLKDSGKTTDFYKKLKEVDRWLSDPKTVQELKKHVAESGNSNLKQIFERMMKNKVVLWSHSGLDVKRIRNVLKKYTR